MADDWTRTDALMFVAVAATAGTRPTPLADVIGCGDAIDHSIVEEEHVAVAFGRLAHAGLLVADRVADAGAYRLTEAGVALSRSQGTRGGLVEGALRALRTLGPPGGAPLPLAAGEYDRAVRAHDDTVRALLAARGITDW